MRGVVVALVCFLGGCAVIASRGDYADYREVRVSEDDEARRTATARYLALHPDGVWADRLRGELAEEEDAYFTANAGSVAGLRRYLEVYADGTHRAEAEARIAALTEAAQADEAADARAREVARVAREEALRARREWGTRSVTFWVGVFAGVERWGVPIETLATSNDAFDDAFASAPRPRCDGRECIKRYELDYAIRLPGATRAERQIEIVVRLWFDEGRVTAGELLMPAFGFSRWYELETRELMPDFDEEARQQAVTWAVARVMAALGEAMGEGAALAPIDVVLDPLPEPFAAGGGAEGAAHDAVYPVVHFAADTPHARVIVFAANIDDEGAGYDGVRFEVLPAPEAP